MEKKGELYKIVVKLSVLSLLLSLFVVMVGAPMNPLIWKQQFERRVDPSVLIQPDSPEVESINRGFEESYAYVLKLKSEDVLYGYIVILTKEELIVIDKFIFNIANIYVQSQIAYKRDIQVYNAVDHLATPTEIMKKGADDCDGQAILITSLLRRRGYDAYVVMGYSHVWTEVDTYGEVVSINNPKGHETWYCKFNEETVQWNILALAGLSTQLFLLFFSFLSVTHYLYKKGYVENIINHLYFFKYILFLVAAFVGFFVIVFTIIAIMTRWP
jgi:hypothetical protein